MNFPDIWFIAKIFVCFGFVVYAVFAGVVIKQVGLMLDTLDVQFEKPIRLLAHVHLGISLFVLLLALLIL